MSFFPDFFRCEKKTSDLWGKKKKKRKKNAPFVLDAVLRPQRRLLLEVPQSSKVVGRVRRHRRDDPRALGHRDRQQGKHEDGVVGRARRRQGDSQELLARNGPDRGGVGVGAAGQEVLVGHVPRGVLADDEEGRGRRGRGVSAAAVAVAAVTARCCRRSRRRRRSAFVDSVLSRRQRPAIGLPEHRLWPQRRRQQENGGVRVRLGELRGDGGKTTTFVARELFGLDPHFH